MSQEERHGTRDRSYSAWHRRMSTRRFIGLERAQLLGMIDLDAALYLEYDDGSKEPLALIETAMDTGQAYKVATVTKRLAMRASKEALLPAYTLLYKLAGTLNPADRSFLDIEMFRVRRIWPEPETQWQSLTPVDWATRLLALRRWSAGRIDAMHDCRRRPNSGPRHSIPAQLAFFDLTTGDDGDSQQQDVVVA